MSAQIPEVLFENDEFLVLNKPRRLAFRHGQGRRTR